jgi:hypothetical protein
VSARTEVTSGPRSGMFAEDWPTFRRLGRNSLSSPSAANFSVLCSNKFFNNSGLLSVVCIFPPDRRDDPRSNTLHQLLACALGRTGARSLAYFTFISTQLGFFFCLATDCSQLPYSWSSRICLSTVPRDGSFLARNTSIRARQQGRSRLSISVETSSRRGLSMFRCAEALGCEEIQIAHVCSADRW